MADRHTLVEAQVSLTVADTEYEIPIPKDAREICVRLDDDAVTWRWSVTAGRVATGGFPMGTGESLNVVEGLRETTLYVASDTASKVAHYSYLLPYMVRP